MQEGSIFVPYRTTILVRDITNHTSVRPQIKLSTAASPIKAYGHRFLVVIRRCAAFSN